MSAHISAVALWSGLQAGERIGGAVLGDNTLHDTRPKRSQHAVLSMIGDLASEGHPRGNAQGADKTLADLLQHLERIAKPGTRIFLISDFHDLFDSDHLVPLRRLARKTQVVAIAISDALEAELPKAGFYAVTDGVSHSQLNTGASGVNRTYAQEYRAKQDQLTRRLRELRVPLLSVRTNQDPLRQLLTVFPAR